MLLDLSPAYAPGLTQVVYAKRILSLLPDAWVSDTAKQPGGVLYALALALALPFSRLASAIAYQQLQTRISTATDVNLDAISSDFFGGALPRLGGESDAAYRTRIKQSILQNKATRSGMAGALAAMGLSFTIVEDGNVNDIMAMGTYGGMGTVGAYGAGGNAKGACYIRIILPLPIGITQSQVVTTIMNVKAEGCVVWYGFF